MRQGDQDPDSGGEQEDPDIEERPDLEANGHEPAPGHPDRRTLLALGARAGIIHSLDGNGTVPAEIPIDERFFNGGSTTVRSFTERDLGPHYRSRSIGGEFFTVFNVEYTFPVYGELLGAVFFDADNLLPNSTESRRPG